MKREIKFRIWHTVNKRFMDGNGSMLFEFLQGSDGTYAGAENKVIPQQYTGLEDKNGEEIYEGDFIKNSDGLIMVVKWNNKYAAFRCAVSESSDGWMPLIDDLVKDFEVIGNIFENPELLKN